MSSDLRRSEGRYAPKAGMGRARPESGAHAKCTGFAMGSRILMWMRHSGKLSASNQSSREGGETTWVSEPLSGPVDMAAANAGAVSEYRLCGYHDYPHRVGVQRVDPAAAGAMSRALTRIITRLANWLCRKNGPPVYLGHPDDPGLCGEPGHDDFTQYAHIMRIEGRADGVWVGLQWTPEGERLRSTSQLWLSPRWTLKPVDPQHRVFRPVKLLSIGLTAHPNLFDAAAANAAINPKNDTMKELITHLLAALGFAQERIEATQQEGESAVSAAEAVAVVEALRTEAESAREALAGANASLEGLSNERARLLVDRAVEDGRIAAAERSAWETRLADIEGFRTAANELESQRAGPPRNRKSASLSRGSTSNDPTPERQAFESAVRARMDSGCDYEEAVNCVMATRQGRETWQRWRDAARQGDQAP